MAQSWIAAELAAIAAAGRLRRRPVVEGRSGRTIRLGEGAPKGRLINWAGNDYLGLSRDLRVRNAAQREARRCGPGAGAARLLSGGLRLHRRVEERLAGWLGREDALLTPSGYQGNLALLGTIAGDGDLVILDRLAHASLYDGARLCGAEVVRFLHNDPADLERQLAKPARRRIVCVESVYSMDGDEAPLRELRSACDRHGALFVVDEAHALGVLGPEGRGLCAELGVVPDAWTATCSKSLTAQGGLLAGDRDLIELVVNRGRAGIYSTALAPAAAGAAEAALGLLHERPDLGRRLCDRAVELRSRLRAAGASVPEGRTPIIPILVGDETATLDLAARLRERGHHAPAIRPPTVPPGGCRLRLSLSLGHRDKDLRLLAEAVKACLGG
jgi:8-amino-7-oxononanoate synthase